MAPCFLSLLLLLLLSATAGGQRHDHWGHHSARHKSATSDSPFTQIRQACKATRFPNVCESTLSDSNSLPPNPSPFDFILATANASAADLQTARPMIQSILDASEKASNINRTNTARICLEVLSYSDRRLSTAFSTALPAGALDDACALASTTLLYQYDCGPALSMSTAPPRSSMPWPSPPFPPLPSPAPAPARVFPYPSVPPYWAEQRPSVWPNRGPLFDPSGSNSSFRSVYQDRTEEDKGKGGPKRLESGRGGEPMPVGGGGEGRRRCRKGFVSDERGEKNTKGSLKIYFFF